MGVMIANIPKKIWKTKLYDETLNTSTTYQNDDELFYNLKKGYYSVKLYLAVTGTTTADIKLKWTNTGTMFLWNSRLCRGMALDQSDADACTMVTKSLSNLSDDAIYGTLLGDKSYITEEFIVQVTVEGILQLQWAQNVSNVNDTTVSLDSFMVIEPVILEVTP